MLLLVVPCHLLGHNDPNEVNMTFCSYDVIGTSGANGTESDISFLMSRQLK